MSSKNPITRLFRSGSRDSVQTSEDGSPTPPLKSPTWRRRLLARGFSEPAVNLSGLPSNLNEEPYSPAASVLSTGSSRASSSSSLQFADDDPRNSFKQLIRSIKAMFWLRGSGSSNVRDVRLLCHRDVLTQMCDYADALNTAQLPLHRDCELLLFDQTVADYEQFSSPSSSLEFDPTRGSEYPVQDNRWIETYTTQPVFMCIKDHQYPSHPSCSAWHDNLSPADLNKLRLAWFSLGQKSVPRNLLLRVSLLNILSYNTDPQVLFFPSLCQDIHMMLCHLHFGPELIPDDEPWTEGLRSLIGYFTPVFDWPWSKGIEVHPFPYAAHVFCHSGISDVRASPAMGKQAMASTLESGWRRSLQTRLSCSIDLQRKAHALQCVMPAMINMLLSDEYGMLDSRRPSDSSQGSTSSDKDVDTERTVPNPFSLHNGKYYPTQTRMDDTAPPVRAHISAHPPLSTSSSKGSLHTNSSRTTRMTEGSRSISDRTFIHPLIEEHDYNTLSKPVQCKFLHAMWSRAGYGISFAVVSAMYEIGRHKEWRERVRDAILSNYFPDNYDDAYTSEGKPCRLFHALAMEAIRKHPPFPTVSRSRSELARRRDIEQLVYLVQETRGSTLYFSDEFEPGRYLTTRRRVCQYGLTPDVPSVVTETGQFNSCMDDAQYCREQRWSAAYYSRVRKAHPTLPFVHVYDNDQTALNAAFGNFQIRGATGDMERVASRCPFQPWAITMTAYYIYQICCVLNVECTHTSTHPWDVMAHTLPSILNNLRLKHVANIPFERLHE